MEFWIWSNKAQGWRGRDPRTYTSELHMAGRFAKHIAADFVARANELIGETDWPIEVMIPVTNEYLPQQSQLLISQYVKTGDRRGFDDAFLERKA